jgi:hypothetical protein
MNAFESLGVNPAKVIEPPNVINPSLLLTLSFAALRLSSYLTSTQGSQSLALGSNSDRCSAA